MLASMIVVGCKAPHLFKQHVCTLPCVMQPRRYAARAACAALSPIAAPATLSLEREQRTSDEQTLGETLSVYFLRLTRLDMQSSLPISPNCPNEAPCNRPPIAVSVPVLELRAPPPRPDRT